ncbi:sigma-70 family RNA polymerase sigma factor [Cohnella xylanilytica]|uniref:sigma-70 family RNA polymerase sigma factor n=1 Tax=Cohnella xylanilytica TaxID=557555 RepID=UPI001FECEB28|nr:sigma-70 family RNA polymerase sigma factor [Cohnella xylanilytica]
MPGFFTAIALFIKQLSLLVSYVKNNAFPQPLTDEEEALHLQRMAEGNPRSRNLLIEHNLRLVAHIVKKFDNTGEDLEDLISIGTIGLIKAIESFQPNKGTKLATFAARCIENEILMHLRSLKKTRKDVSIHDPIGTDKEGNELTLSVYLYSEERPPTGIKLNRMKRPFPVNRIALSQPKKCFPQVTLREACFYFQLIHRRHAPHSYGEVRKDGDNLTFVIRQHSIHS